MRPLNRGRIVAFGVTAGLVAAQALGVDFTESGSLVVASLTILVFGLPHGAFDIELLRARAGGNRRLGPVLGLYLGVAALMAGLWSIAPLVALAVFLGIAVIHFAEDWTGTGSLFLAAGIAAALVSAPAIRHAPAVAAIFVALTAEPAAALAPKLLAAVGPVALAVAVAGIAALIAERRHADAAAAAASLVALVVLPPAIGFAAFFCLFHSPRHFAGALRALAWPRAAQWAPVGVPVVLAALAIVAALYRLHDVGTVPLRLTSATFMALSVLTVPHMVVPRLVRPIEQWLARTAAQIKTVIVFTNPQ